MSDLLKFPKLESSESSNTSGRGYNTMIQPDLMQNCCATTKLFIPNPPPKLVNRQRLVSRLQEITNAKLTVISAPAGFGKTTLISKWALDMSKQINIAWVSLSEEDNDLYSFWSYIIVALRENLEDDTVAYLLNRHIEKSYKIENVINVLINKILISNKETVIILDDYHLIANRLINKSLNYFLSNMPHNIHFVLSTRTKPGIPVSKLRIKEEVLELKTGELRFQKDEIYDLFDRVFDIKLTDKDIETINHSAEGWVTALKVIAFHIKNSESPVVSALDNSQYFKNHLFDYLTEEIINKYPQNIKDFLYRTSILQVLNSSICNDVLQIDDSQEILDLLVENNTFISTLSDKHNFYRYQHIFSDFLQNSLRKYYSEEVDELFLKASRWYEENGCFYEAIDASLKSKNFENCARLLDLYINKILDAVELNRLIRIINSLPVEIIKLKPRICVFYSCALAFAGKMQNDLYLKNIDVDLDGDEFENYKAFLYSVKALDAYRKREIDTITTSNYARKALDVLSEDDPLSAYVKIFAFSSLGNISTMAGEYEEAKIYLDIVHNCLTHTSSLFCMMLVVIQNALLLSFQGKVDETIELFSNTIELLEERKQHRNPCTSIIHLCSSLSYYELNELEKAYESTTKTIELSRMGNDTRMQLFGYIMLTKILLAQGKRKEALEVVKSIEETDYSDSSLHVFRHFRADLTRTIINMEDSQLLSVIEKKFKIKFNERIDFTNEEKNIAAVEILLVHNKYDEAEKNALKVFELASRQKRKWSIVKLLILLSIIKKHQGDNDKANELFGQAVDHAKNCGYIRVFIDFGHEIKPLLCDLIKITEKDAESNETWSYACKLLKKSERDSHDYEPQSEVRGNNVIFSPREMEVFECIIEGLTNDEISKKLYISLSTVKKHIKSIYVKLKVSNRTKAIKVAKQMNVI